MVLSQGSKTFLSRASGSCLICLIADWALVQSAV